MSRKWKSLVSIGIITSVVLGTCITARLVWGPDSASAQQPGRAQAQPSNRTAVPQARTNAPRPAARQNPGVVATVNGEQISREQLGQESVKRYGQDVLESLVNKHLIWQECKQRGITITDKDVETEITRIASKFGLSADRWLTMLGQERDVSPAQYRREIVWPTLALRHLAANEIQVTQQELKEAFENEYGPKVKVRLIATKDRVKAEQVQKQAQADPSKFPLLAKQHSEDASASAQGMIPPVRKYSGVPEVERHEQSALLEQSGQLTLENTEIHFFVGCFEQLAEVQILRAEWGPACW